MIITVLRIVLDPTNNHPELPVLKIVTVDDSPVMVERIQSMLSEIKGVKPLGNARNISEALQLIKRHLPQVVILDIHLEDDMPQANGLNLLITLKKLYPLMKVIILTNLVEPQYRNTCKAFGADYFFNKTEDFEKIALALKELLDLPKEVMKKSRP